MTQRLIDEPHKQAEWIRRLAAYLITNNMTDQVDLIINDIAHELYVQTGTLTVEVTSARQMTDMLRQSLRELLQRETGAEKVVLHETTDQDLLGGFVARTPDAELDASISSKLKALAALK
jgi:F-type H+-transporting ATPase subunit delta